MKLKKWVEIVLIIIAISSGMIMMYDVEISIIPFILGGVVFISSVGAVIEYGSLFNKLIGKLDTLCNVQYKYEER